MRCGVILFFALIIAYIFRSWFTPIATLSAGDWPYLFLENIREFSFFPSHSFLWLVPYYQISAKILVEYLGLNWHLAEKILWFWPFILLSIFSSFYLTRSWLGVLIYTTNTYVLMLVGGGQMGVGLAYSIAPFVLGIFMKLVDVSVRKSSNSKFLLAGFILAVQTMFDPRVAYLTIFGVVIYFLVSSFIFKKFTLVSLFFLLVPVGLAFLLNSFWIVPALKYGFLSTYEGYSSVLGFEFLSFANFSHSLGLLHPNWPENIFGKIYFLQPEFLLLPILAYMSLLFLKSSKSQNNNLISQYPNILISFFAFLGLLGAFLAKGANPPFGGVNEFLFQNFPGMSMFRDATKFYILVILSYSVLIPFTLQKLSEKVSSIKYLIFAIFLIFWLFSIRPAISGQLGGTFKPVVVPQEYIELKDFLQNQPQSFQTFWIPGIERFGFRSNTHPAISAEDYFQTKNLAEILGKFKDGELEKHFRELSIKYVIVPHDVKKELFFTDRKYDESKYEEAKITLKTLPWLKPIEDFEKIAVFELKARE